jgi:hypothetical protein
VVILLLWTGADITNSSLCALEQEQDAPFSQPNGGATLDARSTPLLPAVPDAPHIDDCFCCSHCVEVQDHGPRLISALAAGDLDAVVLASPRIFGVQLYHPPLV